MRHTIHLLMSAVAIVALSALPSCRVKKHRTTEITAQDTARLERLEILHRLERLNDSLSVLTALQSNEWAILERYDTLGRVTERLTKGRTAYAQQTARANASRQAVTLSVDTTSLYHTRHERASETLQADTKAGGSLPWYVGVGVILAVALLVAYALYRLHASRLFYNRALH